MNKFTIPFSVDLPAFGPFTELVPELEFVDLADMRGPGPFVYFLVGTRGEICYTGKSDATTGADGRRALSYAKWSSDYLTRVANAGRPDPMYDPFSGALELTDWSPIVRFATRHSLFVRVARVAHTGETGRVWEARLQALAGILTGLESLVGGSGWEAKNGTLRGAGYEWACERLESLRHGSAER